MPGLRLPARRPCADPAWHLYPVRVLDGRRREVYDRMRAAGIGVQVNYIRPTGTRSSRTSATGAACARSPRRYYAEQLSLPLFPDLTDAEQDRVVECLAGILT